MKTMDNLIATLLSSSSSALAGHAANLLMDRNPESAARFGRDAFRRWQGHLQVQLQELAVAVEFDSPSVFGAAVSWSRESFALRDIPVTVLHQALECLEEVVGEQLPPPASAAVSTCFSAARSALATTAENSNPAAPCETKALAYLESILAGHPDRALCDVLNDVQTIDDARRVHLELVPQAQREAGNLWHAGKIGIHEEHLVSTTTQRLLAVLADRHRPGAGGGDCVIGAAIGENAHDIAVQVVNNLFELAGWRSLCLGSRMPGEDLAAAASDFEADLFVLSATLIPHLIALRHAIRCIRDQARPVKILVGGGAFTTASDLWSKVEADGYAATASDAVRVGAELLH